ncbi:hypothetical protein TNCV_1318401 [Trichonephila clavipes]|nr:hypothetical protein TNCV_1318401 [Trichonephila clavipes]
MILITSPAAIFSIDPEVDRNHQLEYVMRTSGFSIFLSDQVRDRWYLSLYVCLASGQSLLPQVSQAAGVRRAASLAC